MAFSSSTTSWAQQFLTYLGITPTATNVAEVSAWETAESGGVGSYNNPLNTTLHMPGSYGVNYNNGDPVQGYPTASEGIQADAEALTSGVGKYSHYGNILSDLQSGSAPYGTFASDVGASPWGTSGTLIGKVLGTTPTATTTNSPIGTAGGFILNPAGTVGGAVGGVINGATNGVIGNAASSVANDVTSGISTAIQGLIAPIVKPLENIAVRTALVGFGAIAILVGVATMVHDNGSSKSSGGSGNAGGGSSKPKTGGDGNSSNSSSAVNRQPSAKMSKSGAAKDVKDVAVVA